MGSLRLHRRAFLTALGAGAGWLVANGLGASKFAGRGAEPAPFDATLRALAASLSPWQRQQIVLPADHPVRQINNTFAVVRGPHLGTLLSPAQRALALSLREAMLSERGREAFAGTLAVEGRFDGCALRIFGDPAREPAQAIVSGGHLLLRGGAASPGAALLGGVAYGHQIGNEAWRVPGNSFAYHGDAANRFFGALSPAELQAALVPSPPHELVLQVQEEGGRFEGIRVGSASEAAREEARNLLSAVLSAYPDAQQREALACIAHNGGIDALHVAAYESHGFYEDMEPYAGLGADQRGRRGAPYWQVWRIEGPGTVVFFKGHPHVHAYLEIVRDPARSNLGESLARIDSRLEGDGMRDLLEGALRRATGEALAFHGAEVPGRFCPGEVTTGLAYALDPYSNQVVVAKVEGRAMADSLRTRLAARGVAIAPSRTYRVATTDYFASHGDLGEPTGVESGAVLLRDALVAHLRAGGLAGSETAALRWPSAPRA